MKWLIIVVLLFLVTSCGSDLTTKVKIVYVSNQTPTNCYIGFVYASTPDDIIRSESVQFRIADRNKCDEALKNIGRLYTFVYDAERLKSMQREER